MNTKPEYEYKLLNSRDIHVDPLYQRDLNKARVAKIVREFNPYLVNACKVNFRNGKYWVFDGQHTVAAIKAKYGGKDVLVDCKVFHGLTRLDEMELFIQQNGAASAVSTNEKFRALFNNGDPEIIKMVRCCERVGLRVDFSKGQARNKIIALSSLYRSFKTLDEGQFCDMLSILKDAWSGEPQGFSAEVLNGMTKFYKTYYGEFRRAGIVKSLSSINPIAIVRDGKVSSATGATKYARIILGIYNRGRSNRLPDKL